MKNRYEINGDTTAVFLDRKDGSIWECYIDTEDLPLIDSYQGKWTLHLSNGNYYAVNYHGGKIHRIVLGNPDKLPVDHIDGNGLNNRKSNLKVVSYQDNSRNRKGATRLSKSGIRGVGWDNKSGKWRAVVYISGKNKHLGFYDDVIEAGRIATKARLEYFGSRFVDRTPIILGGTKDDKEQ